MKKLHNILINIWHSEQNNTMLNPLIPLLSFLSVLYRLVISLRNGMFNRSIFKQEKLPCKVISVGNIIVGGTGKTPTVIILANFLKRNGYSPAILSRGYGGKTKAPVNIVSDGNHILMEHTTVGDEPVLIAKYTEGIPVIAGSDRSLTGKFAIKNLGADILILDDAFQHRRLYRDVDIVLMNREKPFENGCLLPRGPLREPPESLQRADIILWKDKTMDGRFPQFQEQGIDKFLPVLSGYLKPKAIIRGSAEDPFPLEHVMGKNICAFAGIGSPESFGETIKSLGGKVVALLAFPDHYRYTSTDISDIRERASASGAEMIMTSEKDAIRLTAFPDFLKDTFILRVEMEILPSLETFETVILDKLK
jgi:tetraacyldisaccharide 4'-kinase